MRAGALVLAALLAATSLAAAPLPSPTGPSQQPHAAASQQGNPAEHRGTEQTPVFVKVIPPQKSEHDLAREEAKEREGLTVEKRLADLTADLADYTKDLFIATAILAALTSGLLLLGFFQVSDAKASIAAAVTAAEAAEVANTLSHKIFVSSERPWISFQEIACASDFTYDERGARFTLRFLLKNTGRSPATVSVNPTVSLGGIVGDWVGAHREHIVGLKKRGTPAWGFSLFPGDTQSQTIALSIPQADIDGCGLSFLLINISAGIAYKFVFEDEVHVTGALFCLQRSDRPRPEQPADRSRTAIFPDEGNIAATDLRLIQMPMGSIAD